MDNLWIASLPASDRKRIEPHLHEKAFDRGQVVFDAGEEVDEVWFPTRGVISLMTLLPDDRYRLLIDLGKGRNRLGGSVLAQAYNSVGEHAPDVDALQLKAFFETIQQLRRDDMLLAYHDRSDGGLAATLMEMAFAGHCGIDVNIGMKDQRELGNKAAALAAGSLVLVGLALSSEASNAEPILRLIGTVLAGLSAVLAGTLLYPRTPHSGNGHRA